MSEEVKKEPKPTPGRLFHISHYTEIPEGASVLDILKILDSSDLIIKWRKKGTWKSAVPDLRLEAHFQKLQVSFFVTYFLSDW